MTEFTNRKDVKTGTLYYDGTCGFCRSGIRRIRKPLLSVGVEVCPFENGADEKEMILEWRDGETFGGADAALQLARRFPLLVLPALFFETPPFVLLARAVYRRIAARRHCLPGKACPLDLEPVKGRFVGPVAMVAAILVALVVAIGFFVPLVPWVWMWLVALALWLGFKAMAYTREGGLWEIDPLFFLWPGMNALDFAWERRGRQRAFPLLPGLIFMVAGTTLWFVVIPGIDTPLVRGGLGVAAMLCLLHFGLFDWIAAGYRRGGYPAEPIMREPWRARGLGDFWGNRWNRGFSDWARVFLFLPLTRKLGVAWGTLAGFLASGVAHELVISVPAQGGYGLPTLYFLIQGAGLRAEKRFRAGEGWITRAWMWLVLILPAPLLFHPPFLEGVFHPMTQFLTWTR